MPLYEVEHAIPLGKNERDKLAELITHIHTRKFTTPSLFVNVRFTDISEHYMYIAGKPRNVNRILALVRSGGSRTPESFGKLAEKLVGAWNEVVNGGEVGHGDREMKVVSIQGSITAGIESGFLLPPAGGDGGWLDKNRPHFQALADAGDSDFVDMLAEMDTREDLANK